jgi:membrane associated rhomboid family serine protease
VIRTTGREMTLSFPPFTRAVTWLLGINTAIFLVLNLLAPNDVINWVDVNFGLVPVNLIRPPFEIWQIVTYSFIHGGFGHWFWNMLAIWMFGSAFESTWGSRRFLELFFTGVVGAAITTILLSFAHVLGDPYTVTVGASGGLYAILMAYGMVFGENEIFLFPFPALIKAKYFVMILILLTVYFAVKGAGHTAYLAHLGGLFFGYLYVKFGASRPRSRQASFSEWYYGLRNSFYRWKRRRAARKFEVYMRKHDRDVKFDELGNYVPPEDNEKKNGGSKSGWVN